MSEYIIPCLASYTLGAGAVLFMLGLCSAAKRGDRRNNEMKKFYLSKMTTVKGLKKLLKNGGVEPWLISVKLKK